MASNKSANTPDPGQPISINDVKRVFGRGLGKTPGDDLNDFHGVSYWSTTYPFAAGKFNATLETQLSLEDFYSKTSVDPVQPGTFIDYSAGANKTFTIPVFRREISVAIWGAGGGAGAADHDSVKPAGGAGGTSTIVVGTSTLTATGGGGGTSGYRYGNQNGSGGGGGVASNTGAFNVKTIVKTNGKSGGNGDAGNGRGANGGSAPNGGAGGARGAHNINNKNGYPGTAPGGGGGSGGYSDFKSGKNANPDRAAGGSGGSGAYAVLTFRRHDITPGTVIRYTIGSGGAGSSGNHGNGAAGASGGFKATWDIDN